MRRIRWLGVTVLAVLGLQAFQPAAPRRVLPGEGPMASEIPTPPSVERLLRRACYDCHSAETRWPWYSRVSPLSWLIVSHVQHGRSNLDFSHWSTDPELEPTPRQRLRWMCEEVQTGIMPPVVYGWAHAEARLNQAEKDLICSWSAEVRRALDAQRVLRWSR